MATIVRADEIDLFKLKETGISKGKYLGFSCLQDLYTVKEGCTTYLLGHQYMGKTEFALEILIQLSEFYQWRHCIYTPETGNKEETLAEIVSKYIQKPFYNDIYGHMTDAEMQKGMEWANEYFRFVNAPDGVFLNEYLEICLRYQDKEKIHFDTILGDPFNEFNYVIKQRQDLDIQDLLTIVRRHAVKEGTHIFLTNHPADEKPVYLAKGKSYQPMPTVFKYSGGRAWARKGQSMIACHRQSENECIDNSINYEENAVLIQVQKAKPKGIGRLGITKLYFNKFKNRYYEDLGDGMPMYARHPDSFLLKEPDKEKNIQPYEYEEMVAHKNIEPIRITNDNEEPPF